MWIYYHLPTASRWEECQSPAVIKEIMHQMVEHKLDEVPGNSAIIAAALLLSIPFKDQQ